MFTGELRLNYLVITISRHPMIQLQHYNINIGILSQMVRNSTRVAKQLLNADETPITDRALTPVSMIHLLQLLNRVLHLRDVSFFWVNI